VARQALSSKVWPALATVYVVWGSTYLGIELAIRTIPPFLMCSIRFLAAGTILYALTARGAPRPTLRQWVDAALIGIPLLVAGNGVLAWAEQSVDTGVASVIIASVPLWLALLDRTVFGQRLPRAALGGLLLGFGGVALLVGGGGGDHVAMFALVASSFAWAAGSLYSRRAVPPPRPLMGAGMQMLVGGTVFVGLAAARGELGQLETPSAASLGGLLYLVVVGSLVGYTCYVWLLRNAPTSLVGTYAYVNPLVAVLLGTTVLSEGLNWHMLLGGAIILGAVALILRAPRARYADPRDDVRSPVAASPAGGGEAGARRRRARPPRARWAALRSRA
jgi:drug/metabolite transporter (DMT)-like permease